MENNDSGKELRNLENEFSNIVNLFQDSIFKIKNYAPLINLPNEENMQNSYISQERNLQENIINYEENSKNFKEIIQEQADKINNSFSNIDNIIESLKKNEDFNNDDDNLNKEIKRLKSDNEEKIKELDKKTEYIEELINRIKNDKVASKIQEEFNNKYYMSDFDI